MLYNVIVVWCCDAVAYCCCMLLWVMCCYDADMCGRRYASFNASSELPSGVEEALMFWINKTCAALEQRGDLDIIQGETNQKVQL